MPCTNFTSLQSCLGAALAYAERGWRVLPVHSLRWGRCTCRNADCQHIAKHPRLPEWPTRATSDESQIRSWFAESPEANVGIATGGESGIFVVDVDRKPDVDGAKSLNALEQQYGPLPETLTARTGSGGSHLFFRSPEAPVPSRGGVRPGIDIRGTGGMIVAAPSLHRFGARYEFLNDVDPAIPPTWLLEIVRRHAERKADEKHVEDVMQSPDAIIPKGERNTLLTSIAGKLRWNGLEAPEIEILLRIINEAHCAPPLDESEIAAIARSVARYPAGRERKATWWYRNDVEFYQDPQIKLLADYQRGWYRSLRDAAWRHGGTLPAAPEELVLLAEPSDRQQFLKECTVVLELFKPLEASHGSVLVDEALVRMYLESTALATMKSRAGSASGKSRRADAVGHRGKQVSPGRGNRC